MRETRSEHATLEERKKNSGMCGVGEYASSIVTDLLQGPIHITLSNLSPSIGLDFQLENCVHLQGKFYK